MSSFEPFMTDGVLAEVRKERQFQENKWGQQNHPDGTGEDQFWSFEGTLGEIRDVMKMRCDSLSKDGKPTYESILTEEFFEAIAEKEKLKLRAELVQVAAVAVSWVEKIDRDLLLEEIDVVHIKTADGCKVSVNGQGHFPCNIHTEGEIDD